MNEEIPQSFLDAMKDSITGSTYTVNDLQFESEDYNRGYIDGMNQARKEARDAMSKS